LPVIAKVREAWSFGCGNINTCHLSCPGQLEVLFHFYHLYRLRGLLEDWSIPYPQPGLFDFEEQMTGVFDTLISSIATVFQTQILR